MKKDIYIIKNNINQKTYVGQAKDYLYRFRKHKEEALRNKYDYRSLLYDAMNKYGVNNFYIELLEEQTEDYNNREIYWIKETNSLAPNGYNLSQGGEWYPTLNGILHHAAIIKSEEQLTDIYNDLQYSNFSLTEIASKNNCSIDVIRNINIGKFYKKENYVFPLRNFTTPQNIVELIKKDLLESSLSYKELSNKYNINIDAIKQINYGRRYADGRDYPIRRIAFSGKRNPDAIIEIKSLLKDKSYTMTDISKLFNCSTATLRRINIGETYRDENISYPIR